ncbi:hypothetical protein EXIGLDRAFT_774073 [Exidia glandulosa HHB12029]|uniref:Uncharacterized protein n=1 Tax=Exidia glandulosa HHB12029 TaxID=1314781 RepID=A0A165EIL6_EXIGL|nr:hypothetical protein EXIGLDRAFT_774073 [Exidia glandulosa HHB12029]
MTEGPINEIEYAYGVSFFESDAFASDDYEPCSLDAEPEPEAGPSTPTPAPTLTRRSRVPKSSTPATRAKKLEVMPLVCEEDEPSSSAWSTDEEDRKPSTSSPSKFSAALKKIRKHRPRPLGFIGSRNSVAVVTEIVHSPSLSDSNDEDGAVVFSFPHPPASASVVLEQQVPSSPVTPTTPDMPSRPTASPTPSSSSSSSSVSSPRTPSASDDERESRPRPCPILVDKPLPPFPTKVRHSDGVVENEPDELWERRINEIFELLTSSLDQPLAEASESLPLHSLPVSPTSPTPSRRRGSYAHLIPNRPPPPAPMSPFPAPSPTPSSEGHAATTATLNVPRVRPTPPRSPVPTDIPVDVSDRRASVASSFAASSFASSGFPANVLDDYFVEAPVRLKSRFSTSTRSSSVSGRSRSGSSASGHTTTSRASSGKNSAREGLRRKGIPVELFMRASA